MRPPRADEVSDSLPRAKEPAIIRPRLRSGRRSVARISALTAAVLAPVLAPVLAAGPGRAEQPGRVCMFLAPDNVHGLGHVGWGYRRADGVRWDYGSTAFGDPPWRASGPLPQMLADFRDRETPPDSYLYMRCRSTDRADDAAAGLAADSADAEPYNLFTSNCLTRTLVVFHAYDASADLASLGDGLFTPPRWYFDHDLDGFEPRTRL
jgi:hypothetical protein